MNKIFSITAAATLLAASLSSVGQAQTVATEDFTGASTVNPWYYYN